MTDKAKRQEGLYLLNGLHVDALVKQAREPGNEAMKSQLRRAAASALQHILPRKGWLCISTMWALVC